MDRPSPPTSIQHGSPDSEHRALADLVGSLISMMNAGKMARLDIEQGDLRVSLRAQSADGMSDATPRAVQSTTSIHVDAASDEDGDDFHVVTAPMIGTFYVSPAPGEPPFVLPGDSISEGQTVGIIEAMKIMNEIASDCSGVVVEVLAANGQPVEFGSPLVRLDPIPG